jgi:hypothetical protein
MDHKLRALQFTLFTYVIIKVINQDVWDRRAKGVGTKSVHKGSQKIIIYTLIILSRVWVTYKTGFGLVIGFIGHSLYNIS